MTQQIYLTLWYYSEYRGFWVTSGDTAIKPVITAYEGKSKEALRFFKYAHFVKSDQYRFYEAGINPNKDQADPYLVDPEYLKGLGVLVYIDGEPTTRHAPKAYQTVSDYILTQLKNQESVNLKDLSNLYPPIEVNLALKKLKSQLIIEKDVIMLK